MKCIFYYVYISLFLVWFLGAQLLFCDLSPLLSLRLYVVLHQCFSSLCLDGQTVQPEQTADRSFSAWRTLITSPLTSTDIKGALWLDSHYLIHNWKHHRVFFLPSYMVKTPAYHSVCQTNNSSNTVIEVIIFRCSIRNHNITVQMVFISNIWLKLLVPLLNLNLSSFLCNLSIPHKRRST